MDTTDATPPVSTEMENVVEISAAANDNPTTNSHLDSPSMTNDANEKANDDPVPFEYCPENKNNACADLVEENDAHGTQLVMEKGDNGGTRRAFTTLAVDIDANDEEHESNDDDDDDLSPMESYDYGLVELNSSTETDANNSNTNVAIDEKDGRSQFSKDDHENSQEASSVPSVTTGTLRGSESFNELTDLVPSPTFDERDGGPLTPCASISSPVKIVTPPAPQAQSYVIDQDVAEFNFPHPSSIMMEGGGNINNMTNNNNNKAQKQHPHANPVKDSKTKPSHVKFHPLMKSMNRNDIRAPRSILDLPSDALHCITSLIDMNDLNNFSLVSRAARDVSTQVVHRLRMHAYKCAMEVVTAWEAGEHADAKELTALYISKGVPIYPARLGYSYQTVVWRMKNEAKEMTQPTAEDEDNVITNSEEYRNDMFIDNEGKNMVDRFFLERTSDRSSSNHHHRSMMVQDTMAPPLTYLEEKSLYWRGKSFPDPTMAAINSVRQNRAERAVAMRTRTFAGQGMRYPYAHAQFNHAEEDTMITGSFFADSLFDPSTVTPNIDMDDTVDEPPSNINEMENSRIPVMKRDSEHSNFANDNTLKPVSKMGRKSPKVRLNCHKHLMDQHYSCRHAIKEQEGNVPCGPISLSADFFHPSVQPFNVQKMGTTSTTTQVSRLSRRPNAQEAWVRRSEFSEDHLTPSRRDNPFDNGPLNSSEGNMSPSFHSIGQHFPSNSPSQKNSPRATIPFVEHSVMSDVELSPYSSRLGAFKIFKSKKEIKCKSTNSSKALSRRRLHVRERFLHYEQIIDSLLKQNDHDGFEDCMLDFWDEFFPKTEFIHFYDKQSPVPRVSKLREFLSRPCPKNLGTVQCEIERVRVNPKKKGVNMKGRLFPTYEYRLFVRDKRRRSERSDHDQEDSGLRLDTILMSAKYKGKKQSSSQREDGSKHAQNKKGVNNYHFYMPQIEDVEDHFNMVNALSTDFKDHTHIAQRVPSVTSSKKELGRLQSNFIGTEFQIFSPSAVDDSDKEGISAVERQESDTVSSSPVHGQENTISRPSLPSKKKSRRRKILKSLSMRRKKKKPSGGQPEEECCQVEPSLSEESKSKKKTWLRSRRAIAATEVNQECKATVPEMEIGAITYTANLLGNRPRIMDVCIPEINSNDWKNYCEEAEGDDDGDDRSMLNNLKIMQQAYANVDQHEMGADPAANETTPDHGLLALQNRPPWWNVELGAFVLNFGGRVRVASVKNFQLCDRTNHDDIMLQFGRIEGRHSFTMDYSYPLSPLQAFAIAVSSLQSKISFG